MVTHFGAREYAKTQGRWLSPDPAGLAAVDPSNPPTWNRYAYVMNNPLSYIDPTGLACWPLEKQMFGTCAPFMNNGVNFGANWNLFDLFMGWTSCENGDCQRYTIRNGLAFALAWGGEQINRQWGGLFSCNKTAQQLVSGVRNNFSSFANNVNPTGPNAVFSPGPVNQGATVLIDTSYDTGKYALGQTNAVTVSSVTPTSFTFAVVPGQHFMAAGSTVSFSATQVAPDLVSFSVSANGTTANPFYTLADLAGGHAAETGTWNNLLKNVGAFCHE
jgi:RHS repeat-associated protein